MIRSNPEAGGGLFNDSQSHIFAGAPTFESSQNRFFLLSFFIFFLPLWPCCIAFQKSYTLCAVYIIFTEDIKLVLANIRLGI